MKQEILRAAGKLGFERVRVCAAEPTAHAAYLDEFFAKGRHGTMDWLAEYPATRKHIRSRYEWARSFLVIAIDYSAEMPKLPARSVVGGIARYARGHDYHAVHQPRLKQLEDEVKRIGGAGTKAMWYQDTGCFLERELAARAGLGWIGKNTMLIDPMRGSWTLLALVVTSLELEPDAPITDHCGTCTRCLDACPTVAFPAPYQMDPTRCISYLTIEHKGEIDPAFRPGIGQWLFGCDICNEVCPWNSKAPKAAPELDKEFAGLTLSKILTSKPEHLAKRIAGTPLERPGPANLKRNAAIVAGNARDQSVLPALEQALMTDDEVVQEAVVWALVQLGNRGALARAQKWVTNDLLRDSIIAALAPPAS